MKKNIISKLSGILLSATMIFAAACQPDNPVEQPDPVEPVFPSLVENHNVAPGETLTLTFTPNLDWTVSIPEDCLKWFPLLDGTFKVDKISGKASETPVTISLVVSEQEEFDTARSCEVSLTMGEETRVIAKYTRQAKDRTFAIYAATVENNEFVFGGEDGGYVFSEQEATSVDLVWPEGMNGFRMPVKVDANFEWIMSLPEWAEADVPESTVGIHTFNILGVPSKYPLEGDESKIVFKAGSEVVKEITITIPPCNDKFDFSLGGGMTALKFNGEGDYAVAIGYEAGPATGTVFGPEDIKVYAVDKTADGYLATEAEWVNIKVADWDRSGNVLQTRTVEFSVTVNEGDLREAEVFILPATFNGSISDLFSGSAIKDEFAANHFTITQTKISNEFLTPLSDEDACKSVGLFFEKVYGGAMFNWFGRTEFGYKLTYSLAWSHDEGWMHMKEAFNTYKVFDSSRKEQTGDFWLSVEATENKKSVRVVMDTDQAAEGYVAFYDASGNNLAVLRCIFDPTQAPVDTGSTKIEFIGESASYAGMVGASLVEITEGDLYDSWIEYGAPIYHLTYKMENFPMRITLPKGTVYYLPNPWNKRDLFKVNDLDYDEYVGSFSYIEGGVDIYMSLDPSKPEELVNEGVILFSSKTGDTTESVTLVLLCTLDLRGE